MNTGDIPTQARVERDLHWLMDRFCEVLDTVNAEEVRVAPALERVTEISPRSAARTRAAGVFHCFSVAQSR
jgi:hypothetical protein